MKRRIHVNQHKIRSRDPNPISVKTYRSNDEASGVDIVVAGHVVASVIYRPEHPLPCGARVWIETEYEVVLRTSEPRYVPG